MNGDLESEIGFTQSRLHVNAVVRRVLVRICDRPASNVRGLRRSHARPARVAAYAPARGQRARAPARYPGSRYRFDILWILVRYINPKRNPTRRACACAAAAEPGQPATGRPPAAGTASATVGAMVPRRGLPALFRAARRAPVSYLTEVRASDAPDLTKPLKPDR